MEQVSFTGSMKNVPQAGIEEYVMNFTHRIRNLVTGMQWQADFVLGILKSGKDKETFLIERMDVSMSMKICQERSGVSKQAQKKQNAWILVI